ncbi:MAG: hypothetical protein WCD46_14750, partial [Desulfobacterales bacterium]
GSPETAYIMAAFLLFLSAGMAIATRAPRSLREKATIVTEIEPGKLYHGYFIYQPGYVSDVDDEAVAAAAAKSTIVSRLFNGTRRASAQ